MTAQDVIRLLDMVPLGQEEKRSWDFRGKCDLLSSDRGFFFTFTSSHRRRSVSFLYGRSSGIV